MALRGVPCSSSEAASCSGRDNLVSTFSIRLVPCTRGPDAASASYLIRPIRTCKARQRACCLQIRAAVAVDPRLAQNRGMGREPGPNFTVPTYVTAPGRVVAIGDIHGDLAKATLSLELAGVLKQVDQVPTWCGGNTTVVQLGDVLDRGDQEIGVLLLLLSLNMQAQKHGGAIWMLNGNHESLNIIGNYSFATRGGLQEAAKAAGVRGAALYNHGMLIKGRLAMYKPGGPIARMLACNPTVLIVNNTLFAHGGVLPEHVDFGLQRINNAVSSWMRGDHATDAGDDAQKLAMGNARSVVWNRMFGSEYFKETGRKYVLRTLQTVLERVGATEMVIGHTPQMQGANEECNGQLWRLDTGMSRGVLNAAPQVLEISRDEHGRSVKRLLTAIPVSTGIPIGVPYCQIRWGGTEIAEKYREVVVQLALPSKL